MYPSYLPCIKKFGDPPSACCSVNRKVNDEERLPLVCGFQGMYISFLFRITFTLTKCFQKSSFQSHDQDFFSPCTIRHESMLDISRERFHQFVLYLLKGPIECLPFYTTFSVFHRYQWSTDRRRANPVGFIFSHSF